MLRKKARLLIIVPLVLPIVSCGGGGGSTQNPFHASLLGDWETLCTLDPDTNRYERESFTFDNGNITIQYASYFDAACLTPTPLHFELPGTYTLGKDITTEDGSAATEINLAFNVRGEQIRYEDIIYTLDHGLILGASNDDLRPTALDRTRVYFSGRTYSGNPAYDTLGNFTLTLPEELYDTNDVTVSINSENGLDIATLDIHYQWFINNKAIEYFGASLPQASAIIGDQIAVVISINDGAYSKHLSTEIKTVRLEPVIFSVTDLPGEVQYEELVEFHVSAGNSHIESLPVTIAYGPSNMAIDGDGNVTWIARDIMFTPEQVFKFALTSRGETKEFSVTVVDSARLLPLARSGIRLALSNHNISVDDVDGDGTNEILTMNDNNLIYTLSHDGGTYKQDWLYPFHLPSIWKLEQIISVDIDQDGTSEIIAATMDGIYVIDDRKSLATTLIDIDSTLSIRAIAAADIDNDGDIEIAASMIYLEAGAAATEELRVYDAATGALEFSDTLARAGYEIVIANVDNDPALEVITSGGSVHDGITGEIEWDFGTKFGNSVTTGDFDGDGIEKIIVSGRYTQATVYDAISKTETWKFEDKGYNVTTGNIDLDPQDELIIAGDVIAGEYRNIGGIQIFDMSTGSPVEQNSFQEDIGSTIRLTTGDADSDGYIELIWTDGGSLGVDSHELVVSEFGDQTGTGWRNDPFITGLGKFGAAGWAEFNSSEDKAIYVVSSRYSTGAGGPSGQRIVHMSESGETIVSENIAYHRRGGTTHGKVVDYDNDGISELLLNSNLKIEYSESGTLFMLDLDSHNIDWYGDINKLYGPSSIIFAEGDLNSDEYTDAVVIFEDPGFDVEEGLYNIYAFDIYNDETLSFNAVFDEEVNDIAIVDLDQDGISELLIATETEISSWKRDADNYIRTATLNKGCTRIQSGELTEGKLNIICAYAYRQNPTYSRITILDSSLREESSTQFDGIISDLIVEDGSNPVKNIIVAYNEKAPKLYAERISTIQKWNPYTGKVIWSSPNLLGLIPSRSLHYAPDKGGNKRLIFATDDAMYLTR